MEKRILIAAPVRQKEEIFIEYLNSINHLIIPEGYTINKFFILHNCPNLKKYLKEDEYIEITDDSEFKKENNKQKKWTKENFKKVADLRTFILKVARNNNFDYLFTIDSDILLHPKTLISLLKDNKKIVGNLLWTKMENRISPICGENEEWGAYEDETFLYQPGLYPIGWTCACVLINSTIFNNVNISYYPINGVDNTGCEDYAFCLRVKCNFPNEEIWIDTRYPARHLYHEKDYNRWMMEKKQYE